VESGDYVVKIKEVLSEGPLNWFIGRYPKKPIRQATTSQPVSTPPAQATTTVPTPPAAAEQPELIGGTHNPKHDLAPGVTVVSQEPIIIQYRNKDYAINDRGQWVHLASGKTPHESFQQFLSAQHDISLGTGPTQGPSADVLPANAVAQNVKPAAPTVTPADRRQQRQQAATQAARASMTPVQQQTPQVLRQNPERAKAQQQLAARRAADAQKAEREADWNRHASGTNEE
jgi:hypothetical protein